MHTGKNSVLHQRKTMYTPVKMAALIVIVELINTYHGFAVCLLAAGWYILCSEGTIHFYKMPGRLFLYLFFLWGIVLGLLQVMNGNTTWWPMLRDAVNFARIPLYWYLFSSFSEEHLHDDTVLYKTVFCVAAVLSAASLFSKGLLLLGKDFSFESFRETGNYSEFSLAIGCFLILFPPECIKDCFFSPTMDRVAKGVIIGAALISFSRTVVLILLCLCVFQMNHHWRKVLAIITAAAAFSAVISVLLPDAAVQYGDKVRNSFSEISSAQVRWTSSEIVRNWRGYEVHCAQEAFRNADIWGQLFGRGFGSGIDAFGYEYLVTSEQFLPFLHNGYYTTLFKFGAIGVFAMALYYLCFFVYSLRVDSTEYKLFLLGMILAQYLTTTVISGMLWGGCDLSAFLVMAWHMSYVKCDEPQTAKRLQTK